MPRTKIICTIGPSTRTMGAIESLIEAGMDVARLNFSHGTLEEHRKTIELLRTVSKRMGRPVAILQDLQGPKIRVGALESGSLQLKRGSSVTVTTREVTGGPGLIPSSYPRLAKELRKGNTILLDDGLIRLKVIRSNGVDLSCRVIVGGLLKEHQGINLPGVTVSTPALTEKDLNDLKFGLSKGVDYLALSFIQAPADITDARKFINKEGAHVPLIAKLERPQAIRRLDEILDVADGVMVARGDLGVEMEPETVPLTQKEVIRKANLKGVPVITATEMLESMVEQPRPTRAEASDVANAVLDGTDAVMLSAETATGDHPVEAVQFMVRILNAVEEKLLQLEPVRAAPGVPIQTFPQAVSLAACQAAAALNAVAIVAFTQTGSTARYLSRYRPLVPIIAFTPHQATRRRMALYWGVTPMKMGVCRNTDEMITKVDRILLRQGLAREGDIIALVAGTPVTLAGQTNLLKLHRLGSAI